VVVRPALLPALLLLGACTHRILEGSNPVEATAPPPEPPPARAFAVARVCPDGAQPSAQLLAARIAGGWTAKAKELGPIVRYARLARIGVFAWEGKRAGIFTVGGATGPSPTVVGGFAGRRPCDPPILGPKEVDPLCKTVMGACALGVGWVDPPDLDSVPEPQLGTACALEGRLVVDVDRDGTPESFPLAALAAEDGEVTGGPRAGACPKPAFATRLTSSVDLVAVVDLDEDGRFEIVLQSRSRWILYAAKQSASRLDRVATLETNASSRPSPK
jgi:hypothetical protein